MSKTDAAAAAIDSPRPGVAERDPEPETAANGTEPAAARRLPLAALAARALLLLGGSFVIAAGSVLMIKAEYLGLHPYDVLEYALTAKLGFSFGVWHWAVGLVMVLLSYALTRRLPRPGVFLEFFLVGAFIDMLLASGLFPGTEGHLAAAIACMLAGIFLVSLGTALYMSADFGAGPTDWFSLVVSEKYGLSFGRMSIATEGAGVLFGFLLGGPVQAGTLIFFLVYGPITDFFLRRLRKRLPWSQPEAAAH